MVEPLGSKAGSSRFRLSIPQGSLAMASLRLRVSSGFVERSFALSAQDDRGEWVSALTGSLRKLPEEAAIELALPARRTAAWLLEVRDGDDAPLAFSAAEGLIQSRQFLVVAPAGEYRVFLGAPSVGPPSYQLAAVQQMAEVLAASEVHLEQVSPNPNYSAMSGLTSGNGSERMLLWAVLGLGVLVLGGLTVRLARRQSG